MSNHIIITIIPLIAILVLDAIWLTLMMPIYKHAFGKVQCNAPIRFNWKGAIIAYALMYVGFLMFVKPNLDKTAAGKAGTGHPKADMKGMTWSALMYGATFGLVVYGIFNATNAAVFSDYDWTIALVDTVWGCSLFFYVSLIYLYFL
jgi:uncharacterized membrane protein